MVHIRPAEIPDVGRGRQTMQTSKNDQERWPVFRSKECFDTKDFGSVILGGGFAGIAAPASPKIRKP